MNAAGIIQGLGGDPRTGMCRCPCHDDSTASLHIEDMDGKTVCHCFAGCAQDVLIEALRNRGLWGNGTREPGEKGANGKKAKQDGWTPLPIPPGASEPPEKPTHKDFGPDHLGGPAHRVWIYRNSDGRIHSLKCRWDYPGQKPHKHDRPFSWGQWGDKPAGWSWGGGVKPQPLLRLPEINSAPEADMMICEGEPSADAVMELYDVLGTTNCGGGNNFKNTDWSPLQGRTVFIWPDNDPTGDGFGRAVAELAHEADAQKIFIAVLKVEKPEKWDAADALAEGLDSDSLDGVLTFEKWEPTESAADGDHEQQPSAVENAQQQPGEEQPRIEVVGGALPGMVDSAETALMAQHDHGGLYQRGGQIVRVIRLEAPQDGIIRRSAGSPLIVPLEPPGLVEAFTRAAEWVRWDARKKNYNSIDCPIIVGATYAARAGMWNLRPLTGIISAPTLRRDGSILERPGYDERTGLLFLGDAFPPIPSKPSRDDAIAALEILTEPIKQFPFVEDCHQSVALSAILTALVRRSIKTAPLFGFSAPTMGSGKSLLADVAAIIATGYPSPAMSQGHDETEDRKKLLASLTEGDSILLIDNVDRPIEGGVLCSMLTQTEIRDRAPGVDQNGDRQHRRHDHGHREQPGLPWGYDHSRPAVPHRRRSGKARGKEFSGRPERNCSSGTGKIGTGRVDHPSRLPCRWPSEARFETLWTIRGME